MRGAIRCGSVLAAQTWGQTHSEMQQAGGGYLSNYQPRSEVLFAGQGTSGIV